jgi:hypothetical protein
MGGPLSHRASASCLAQANTDQETCMVISSRTPRLEDLEQCDGDGHPAEKQTQAAKQCRDKI